MRGEVRGERCEVRGRKPVGKSESKTKLEPQARPFFEINESEP